MAVKLGIRGMLGFRNIGLAAAAISSAVTLADPEAADDYRWLEEPTGSRALTWAREHTTAATGKLQARPGYELLLGELEGVLKGSSPTAVVTLLGDKAVRLQRDAAHRHGRLQVAKRAPHGRLGDWRTVLDVEALRNSEGKPYDLNWWQSRCAAPEFDRCLLYLSEGGSDDVSIREFDLAAGQFVEGGFTAPPSRTQLVWLDADTVLIAHTLGDSPRTAGRWAAAVRLWRRGESMQDAPIVFQAEPTDAAVLLFNVGASRRALIQRMKDYSTFEIFVVDTKGAVTKLPLPAKLKPFGVQATTERHLIVSLAEPANVGDEILPAETVLAYDFDPKTPDNRLIQVVYRPKAGEVVTSGSLTYEATRTRVFLPVQNNLKTALVAAEYSIGGWIGKQVLQGEAGVDLRVVGANPVGEDIVVYKSGFLRPESVELISPKGPPVVLARAEPAFDGSKYTVEVKSAPSKDGMLIDYYLVRPLELRRRGETPTLITGYGAFGVSMTPAYLGGSYGGASLKLWLDRGGALAVAAIRGGGERGEAWHQAAIRHNRQKSYDDFIAVTEDLVRSGFTMPDHIGIFGTSNGGLLTAAVAVQRPDLFGAVVSDAPITDMLRYPEMGIGGGLMNEYGDPDDPVMRRVLESYSPFHNVKPGVKYPPFMITIATTDNRVGPGHARKMAARLEEVGTEVYFLEADEGGHGVSDALNRPEMMSMRMQFLIDKLMK